MVLAGVVSLRFFHNYYGNFEVQRVEMMSATQGVIGKAETLDVHTQAHTSISSIP